MRKYTFLICLCAIFYSTSAQLNKTHSFDDQTSTGIQVVGLENEGQKYCVVNRVDSITYQCIFYNLDYSVFKTISIDLGPLFIVTNYNSPYLIIRYIAENLFDQDGDIDLLGQLTYYDNLNDEYAQVIVFHENGNTLFTSDIENSNAWLLNSSVANSTIHSSVTKTDAGAKLILDVYYFNDQVYSYDVYDLPGSVPSSLSETGLINELSGNYLKAYPVPAKDFVDMEYRLAENQKSGVIEIIDEQGKTLQKVRVDENKGVVRLPVTHYSNGLYYYKLNTRRGIPRSGKMIIMK
jgi:hypothetical protein